MRDAEKKREYDKLYHERNKDKRKARTLEMPEIRQAYLEKNKTRISLVGQEYYNKNKDIINLRHIKYYSENKERIAQRTRDWQINNRSYVAASRAKYRASKLRATPVWVDTDELFLIGEAYELAGLREELTGIKWHVDHIVPLQSKKVCGLHTIKNLSVIPARVNMSKGNKFNLGDSIDTRRVG